MEGKTTNKTTRVTLRLAPAEFESIHKKYKRSTCRKISEYLRSVLLGKPVTILTRDKSEDEVMHEITRLRSELNSIGSNLNQATKKLHSLSQISEFREYLQHQDAYNSKVQQTLNEVKTAINKLSDRWLQ